MNQKPVVIMEDDLTHRILPDGRISMCEDDDCPCHDEPEPMDDDYINLSARSVAETEPDESSGSDWYLSRPSPPRFFGDVLAQFDE